MQSFDKALETCHSHDINWSLLPANLRQVWFGQIFQTQLFTLTPLIFYLNTFYILEI